MSTSRPASRPSAALESGGLWCQPVRKSCQRLSLSFRLFWTCSADIERGRGRSRKTLGLVSTRSLDKHVARSSVNGGHLHSLGVPEKCWRRSTRLRRLTRPVLSAARQGGIDVVHLLIRRLEATLSSAVLPLRADELIPARCLSPHLRQLRRTCTLRHGCVCAQPTF